MKNLPYSILELASVTENSTIKRTLEQCLDLAQKAEQWGYNRFWLAEHHNTISIASSATVVLMDYIANGTQKIRVGSGGIMLPNHSSLIVAEQFGTLGNLYPGRIDMGLGRAPGTDQITAQAIRPDRMQAVYRFEHELDQIQEYFSSENKNAKVRVPLAEGVDVPIYILGSSTDSAHLAARKGLPYAFASHFAPAHLFEALNIYYNEFQSSEYLTEPYTIAGINVIAAETDAEAEKLSTSMLQMILGLITNKMNYLKAPTDMTAEMQELKRHPALSQFMKYAFVGSKGSVRGQTIEFLQKSGVDEVIVASHIYDHGQRLRSFEIFSEIMQEF